MNLLFSGGDWTQDQIDRHTIGDPGTANSPSARTSAAGHRRFADQAIRPEGRRGRHPSQPHSGARRSDVLVRPHLGYDLISLALRHPQWGAVGLPLRAMLYVRRKTMAKIPPWRQWRFATKLELAAKLVEWIVPLLKNAGKAVWIVIDGGYTKRPFLDRALKLSGVVVVGRLRKDAALRDLPPKLKPGKPRGRGRPRKYGKNKISLAKRAGQKRGWQTAECTLYGETVTKPSWPLTDRSAALSELCWSKKIMVGLRSSVLSRKPVRWKYWKPLPTVPRSNRTSTMSRKSGDRANNRFETSGRTSPSTT